ncbi:MAG: C40 family peptidase [Eubacteriales bacterium]|nr:C40 family peptidase [Eubacteriales bacterium]
MKKNRVTAVIVGACILLGSSRTAVMAAPSAGDEAVFSDGPEESVSSASEAITDGDINKMAYSLVEKTEEEAQKYLEEKEAAQKAAEEKAAEEEKKKREEYRKKAEEEARKQAEEARKKAEEERLAKRQEIVDFALQFEGNPYVYGGTSLTNGADCSGFVMAVFREFGYELPRVAAAQYSASTQKSLEDMEPGDLVFYGDYGIDHVALYIGNNQIIHASTSATGIKISDFNYRQPAGVGSYLK